MNTKPKIVFYSREATWGCADGRDIKIKDLENSHLLNIIVHIKKHFQNYNAPILNAMETEARLRKLDISDTFVPYIDPSTKLKMMPNGSWYYPFAKAVTEVEK